MVRPPPMRILLIILLLASTTSAAPPTHDQLVARVQANGAKTVELAQAIVVAVETHATPDFPVDFLLGLSDVESNFEPASTSRLYAATWDPEARRWVGGHRVAGNWYSTKKPPGSVGTYCCGITQVMGKSWKKCLALRDVNLAVQTSVSELTYWLRRGKTIQRALQGYGCGNSGMKGACKPYAAKVLKRSRIFSAPAPTLREQS